MTDTKKPLSFLDRWIEGFIKDNPIRWTGPIGMMVAKKICDIAQFHAFLYIIATAEVTVKKTVSSLPTDVRLAMITGFSTLFGSPSKKFKCLIRLRRACSICKTYFSSTIPILPHSISTAGIFCLVASR